MKEELKRMNDEFDYQCVTIYMNISGKIAYPLHRKFRRSRTCTGDEHIMIIYQTHINMKAALAIHTFYASFFSSNRFIFHANSFERKILMSSNLKDGKPEISVKFNV